MTAEEIKKRDMGLMLLRAPFEPHQISKLPKPFKKDSPKSDCKICGGYHGQPAMHLDYVGHAALTDRLLSADPLWDWKPLALTPEGLPAFDKTGGLWIQLTVCGMTRLGYGNAENSSYKEVGSREKEVIGDALRNAGMRFGAALELWHKGELHPEKPPENEPKEEPKNDEPKPATEPTPPVTPSLENHAPIGMARSIDLKKKIKDLSATWSNEKIDQLAMVEYGKPVYEVTASQAQAMIKYAVANPVVASANRG